MAKMRLPANANKHYKPKKGVLKRLLKILFKNFKGRLVLVLVCLILATLSNLTSSLFVKFITDEIVNGVTNQLTPVEFGQRFTIVIALMAAFYSIGLLASFIWNRTMAIITHEYLNGLRKQLFDHMQSLPIKYFDTHQHGDLMSLYTNDIDTIRQLISQSLPSVVQTSSIVVSLFFIIYRNKDIYLSIVCIFAFSILVDAFVAVLSLIFVLDDLWFRIILFVLGFTLTAIGIAFVEESTLSRTPFECFVAVMDKIIFPKFDYAKSRIFTEVIVTALGAILGLLFMNGLGNVGIGTAIYMLCTGPAVHFFIKKFSRIIKEDRLK